MLSQNLIREALLKALSTGADYAEVYAEHTRQKSISLVSAKVDKIADAVISGVGIRIFKGTRCVAGSASSLDPAAVLACAARVADALSGTPESGSVILRERLFGDIHPVRIVPAGVENAVKIDYVREACLAAQNYSQEISQVTGGFLEVDHNILIATSEGLLPLPATAVRIRPAVPHPVQGRGWSCSTTLTRRSWGRRRQSRR